MENIEFSLWQYEPADDEENDSIIVLLEGGSDPYAITTINLDKLKRDPDGVEKYQNASSRVNALMESNHAVRLMPYQYATVSINGDSGVTILHAGAESNGNKFKSMLVDLQNKGIVKSELQQTSSGEDLYNISIDPTVVKHVDVQDVLSFSNLIYLLTTNERHRLYQDSIMREIYATKPVEEQPTQMDTDNIHNNAISAIASMGTGSAEALKERYDQSRDSAINDFKQSQGLRDQIDQSGLNIQVGKLAQDAIFSAPPKSIAIVSGKILNNYIFELQESAMEPITWDCDNRVPSLYIPCKLGDDLGFFYTAKASSTPDIIPGQKIVPLRETKSYEYHFMSVLNKGVLIQEEMIGDIISENKSMYHMISTFGKVQVFANGIGTKISERNETIDVSLKKKAREEIGKFIVSTHFFNFFYVGWKTGFAQAVTPRGSQVLVCAGYKAGAIAADDMITFIDIYDKFGLVIVGLQRAELSELVSDIDRVRQLADQYKPTEQKTDIDMV